MSNKKKIKISKIEIDREKCIGDSSCVAIAPDVFDLDDEYKAFVKNIKGADDETILLAAKSCPTKAISVYNEKGEKIFPED